MNRKTLLSTLFATSLAAALPALAQVSAADANKLKGEYPLRRREGRQQGQLHPAWSGSCTRPSRATSRAAAAAIPFKDEKPLYTITAKNVDQYADKLSDGVKALFESTRNTYRIDVKTHRTAAAPQWVYDNTLKNAANAKFENEVPVGIHGGIPFPIEERRRGDVEPHPALERRVAALPGQLVCDFR